MSSGLTLEQLGAQAKAHVDKGDQYKDKSEQMYKAAGIYLIEAKEMVFKRKDLSWSGFLSRHCDIGRSRADEIIMIADGRTTLEQVRERKAASQAKTWERRKSYEAAATGGGSAEIREQNQRSPSFEPPVEPPIIQEARQENTPLRTLQFDVKAQIMNLSYDQLKQVETFILQQFGNINV